MEGAAIHGPYEDAIIAVAKVVEKVIEGQPPDVKAELWRMFLADVKEFRAFFKT